MWSKVKHRSVPYLFLLPFFLFFLIFFLWPIWDSLRLSLYKQVGIEQATFVGLDNYRLLFSDRRFLHSIVNTTYYAAGSVFVISPMALVLAIVFESKKLFFREFFRLAFLVPVIISNVVISVIFLLIYEQDYGIINATFQFIGLPKVPWLRSSIWAMPSIILLGIWTYVGINALYFLAGLQGIPEPLKEAARIDGANEWQVFRHITIPLLRPVILFVVVQAIIGSYNLFAQPYVLTRGGPEDATLTMTLYLYQTGFVYANIGYAAAIGYVLALIIFALSIVQFFLFGTFREESA